MAPFPRVEVLYSFVDGISTASFPFALLVRMIPTVRNPARQETATTAAITIPAMAPEARCEDDLEVFGLLDALDASKDEDIVASSLDQQMGSRLSGTDVYP